MTPAHTPGPWEVRRIEASRPTQLVYCQILPAVARKPKALAYAGVYGKRADGSGPDEPGQPEEECEANAKLIAAAPELLEACKQALDWLEDEGAPVAEQLRAAIAKAKD